MIHQHQGKAIVKRDWFKAMVLRFQVGEIIETEPVAVDEDQGSVVLEPFPIEEIKWVIQT